MDTPFVIIGAGGFGREVRDWLIDRLDEERMGKPWGTFAGFLDDGQPDLDRLARLDAPHLGGVSWLSEHPEARYYIAVGNPGVRRRIVEMCDSFGAQAGQPLIHPSAIVGSDCHLGEGVIVCPKSVITTNVQVGSHTHLNLTTTVGHDTTLGDFVTVNPGATISGEVTVGDGVTIGTGASVNQGLAIGADTVVGAGAAVVRDLDGGITAVGVPAKRRN